MVGLKSKRIKTFPLELGSGQGVGRRDSCPGHKRAREQRIDVGWYSHSMACNNSEEGGANLESLPWVLDDPVPVLPGVNSKAAPYSAADRAEPARLEEKPAVSQQTLVHLNRYHQCL